MVNGLEFILLTLFRTIMCLWVTAFLQCLFLPSLALRSKPLQTKLSPGVDKHLHLLDSMGTVPACFKGKFYPVFIPAYKAWKGLGGHTSTTVISGRIKQKSNSWAEWASPHLITNGFGNKQRQVQSQWKTSLFLPGSCSGCVETSA